MLEKEIEKQILDYLTLKGFYAWKNPTIGLFDTKRGKFRKPNNKYLISGVSDIIAIKQGKVYFIEVKTDKGRQTPNQKLFESNIDVNGGVYILARSIEDLKDIV